LTSSAFGAQGASLIMLDSSAGSSYGGFVINSSTTVVTPTTNASPVAGITATAPFTWATSDVLALRGWCTLA
jgi:hypothetical protein